MDTNFEKNKSDIGKNLVSKIPSLECPLCKNKKFTFAGGYFAHDLQKDLQNRSIGGINIPTVPIICANCGFIAEIAAGTLGLLPNLGEKPDKKSGEEGKTEKGHESKNA